MFEDKTLECRVCGQEFIFSAGEQEFYQQKGLTKRAGKVSKLPPAAPVDHGPFPW